MSERPIGSFCSQCGESAAPGAAYCSACGTLLRAAASSGAPATVTVAPRARSYRWAWVTGVGVATFLLFAHGDWALGIVGAFVFWPLLLWAIIASAVSSGVQRG